MNRTARASVESADTQHPTSTASARAHRARVEEGLIDQLTTITLVLGPVIALASAAVLTMADESLRVPAIFAFVCSIGGVATAHRACEARGAARRQR